jgi:hypothetical protein
MNVDCKQAIADAIVVAEKHLPNYDMVSCRSVLREAGYDNEEIGVVLRYIADHGFEYCLDATIECSSHGDPTKIFPSANVCYWGPDQLISRLECIR